MLMMLTIIPSLDFYPADRVQETGSENLKIVGNYWRLRVRRPEPVPPRILR